MDIDIDIDDTDIMKQFQRLRDFPSHPPHSPSPHRFPLYYYNTIVLQQQSHVHHRS